MNESKTAFSLVKTQFLNRLDNGYLSSEQVDSLQSFYSSIGQPILEVVYFNDKQSLIRYLTQAFSGIDFDQYFVESLDCEEPKFISVCNDQLNCNIIGQKIFSSADGFLLRVASGDYELIRQGERYFLGIHRSALLADDVKIFPVTREQVADCLSNSGTSLASYVEQLRLQTWKSLPVWIVEIEVNLACNSYFLTSDRTGLYFCYVFVPATTAVQAEYELTEFLNKNEMLGVTIRSISKFSQDNYSSETESTISLLETAETVFEFQRIHVDQHLPFCLTSLLISADSTIVSKSGMCGYEYWSKRIKHIRRCEYFSNDELCFKRLLELQLVSADDVNEFNELSGDDFGPVHYILNERKRPRFEKVQTSFEADWIYHVEQRVDGLFVRLSIPIIDNKQIEIQLNEIEANCFEHQGVAYLDQYLKRW